jgi:hypothetical protein
MPGYCDPGYPWGYPSYYDDYYFDRPFYSGHYYYPNYYCPVRPRYYRYRARKDGTWYNIQLDSISGQIRRVRC